MKRIIIVYTFLFSMTLALNSDFEVSFFSADQEKIALDFSLHESEFNSYLQKNPVHLAKLPLLIINFVVPSRYYYQRQNHLLFFSDSKQKNLISDYTFTIVSSSMNIIPQIYGGKKQDQPFGYQSQYKNTFYLVLPPSIFYQSSFYLIIDEKNATRTKSLQIPFYYSERYKSFYSRQELHDKTVNHRLENEDTFSSIDRSGQIFFIIKMKRKNQSLDITVQIKNLSPHSQSLDPLSFILDIPGCGMIKSHSVTDQKNILLLNSEYCEFDIRFDLPSLPKLDETRCFLSYNSGQITFEKMVIL